MLAEMRLAEADGQGRAVEAEGGVRDLHRAFRRMLERPEEAGRGEVRVGIEVFQRVDRAAGDFGPAQQVEPFGRVFLTSSLPDSP